MHPLENLHPPPCQMKTVHPCSALCLSPLKQSLVWFSHEPNWVLIVDFFCAMSIFLRGLSPAHTRVISWAERQSWILTQAVSSSVRCHILWFWIISCTDKHFLTVRALWAISAVIDANAHAFLSHIWLKMPNVDENYDQACQKMKKFCFTFCYCNEDA